MAVSNLNVTNNPFSPGMSQNTYIPDLLIAGDEKLVTEQGTFTTNATVYARGQVMGQITTTGKWIRCVKSAVDGSQVPAGIVVDATDATGADVVSGLYVKGEFNFAALTFDASWGAGATALANLTSAGRANSLYIKSVLGAADPS